MKYYLLNIAYYKNGISRELIYLFFLLFLPIILYSPVLLNSNGFVWDDPWMLVDNPFVRSLNLDNIRDIFTKQYEGQYSPVNTLYYCVLYALFGLSPFVFHLTNILLHTINSLLVFDLIKRLLSAMPEKKMESSSFINIAFACSLLFCIATVQVEVVAWISASKVLLYTFFSLLSLLEYIKYIRTRKPLSYILCLILYILAIGSKEQAIILPLSFLSIDYYLTRNLGIKKQWDKIPMFAIALSAGLISLSIQDAGFQSKFENDYFPFWQRLLLSFYSICQYLVKILLPLRVHSFYDFPMNPGEPLPSIFLVYVPVFGLIVYYLIKYRKNRELMWGAIFFLINLSLALHLLPLGRDTLMADRYCYIPSIGVFFICSFYFFDMLKKTGSKRKLVLALAVVYLAGVFLRSYIYIEAWSKKG